ncbi:MAG: DUF1553 domain-containing protein [Cytophagaceae bacterium]|nr:DUF1553 domain-containing protein [Cytophagaceae bacterium]
MRGYPKKLSVNFVASLAAVLVVGASFWQIWWSNRVEFNRDVRPILNKKCIVCHGGVKKNGGFSVLFREEALGKTKSGGPAIIPGHADQSEFIRRLTAHDPDERMPLDAEPLSEQEIATLTRWINQGAEWEDHWAYLPPNQALSPPEAGTGWAKNGIDRFVSQKLQTEKLTPAPEADLAVLHRRLSLDLTGLPPTPAEHARFRADRRPNAYEWEVDRLLASPAFGERWASLWLDLARYADSKGYEKDLPRTVWKYRDWVIDDFNHDMPFDQFTVEQLAGDRIRNRNGASPTESQLIATAFHRNTMANDEGGTNDEEFRNVALLDRVGTTWEVWQGTTMTCVQCHSHPYDPIRHEDFYRFAAYFNNTQDRDIYNEKPNFQSFEKAEKQHVARLFEWIETQLKPADRVRPAGRFPAEQRQSLLWNLGLRRLEAEDFDGASRHIELWDNQTTVMQTTDEAFLVYENVDLSGITGVSYRYYSGTPSSFIELHLDSLNGPLVSRAKTHSTEAKPNSAWFKWAVKFTETPASVTPTTGRHTVFLVFRKDLEFRTDLLHLDRIDFQSVSPVYANYPKAFQDSLERLRAIPAISTPILLERPAQKARRTHVFVRGNWLAPGAEVRGGLPAILARHLERPPQDRLAMARWLVSPENPLTARVMVNRFWEQLFGYGLVETPEDFGTQGFKPTHPELLDWLAVQFQRDLKWSMKKLLRLLVTSATYRQSAVVSKKLVARDPRNLLLARGPRVRLTAEQLRDQALAVSGLLNPTMHGPPVLPPSPLSGNWRNQPAGATHRRAVYTFWQRTNPYPSMVTFDSPKRDLCTSRRIRTNTPLQALTTLNDTVYVEAARHLAQRVSEGPGQSTRQQLSAGYEQVLLRKPSVAKLILLEKMYAEGLRHYREKPEQAALLLGEKSPNPDTPHRAALTLTANAILNLDEVLTK